MDQFSTYVREYLAIKQLEFSKYIQFILDHKTIPPIPSNNIRDTVNPSLFSHLNQSQLSAVYGVLECGSPLALIHGPPGTGKTQTIVGLLDLIHLIDNKPNILICAPSNGAIDELVFRIMYSGFRSQEGKVDGIKPKVVRLGKSTDKSINQLVNQVSLEALGKHYMYNQGESEEIKKMRQMITDNEEMLKRIMKSNHDGSKDTIIEQTKREIIRLNKTIDRKCNGPKRGFNGGDMIKIENQILEE